MFFYIGDNCDLLNKVSDRLFLDEGWTHTYINDIEVWYKGYALECNLSKSINQILEGYTPNGIWCVLSKANNQYKVHHAKMRGFPLMQKDNVLTTIEYEDFDVVLMQNQEYVEQSLMSVDQISNDIFDILVNNVENFVRHNTYDIHIVCTGGVDSHLCLALLEFCKVPYTLYLHTNPKVFVNSTQFQKIHYDYESKLLDFAKKNWGFNVVNILKETNLNVTGFYGDEYFIRNPEHANLLARSINKNYKDLIKPTDYFYYYYNRSDAKYNYPTDYVELNEAKKRIFNSLIYQFQMWHIDNNINFCPYYDLDIPLTMLRMGTEELLDNATHATIQKRLIEKVDSDLLLLLDQNKNTVNDKINFVNNLNKVNLKYCTKKIIK